MAAATQETRTLTIGIMLHGFKVLTTEHQFILDVRLFFSWNTLPDEPAEWQPEWNVFNQEGEVSIVDQSTPSAAKAHQERKYNVRLRVVCSCALDFHRFPFDTQRMEGVIRIPRVHKQKIGAVKVDPQRSGGLRSLHPGSSWVAGVSEMELAVVEASVVFNEPESDNYKPDLRIALSMLRLPNVYLVQIVWPMYCLAFFSLGSFHVNPIFVDRSSYLVTLLLTIVALKFVIVTQLPKLSYQTDMDHFVHLIFLYLALNFVYNMFLPFVSAARVERVDSICAYIFAGLFGALTMVMLVYLWKRRCARHAFSTQCLAVRRALDDASATAGDTKGMARHHSTKTALSVITSNAHEPRVQPQVTHSTSMSA